MTTHLSTHWSNKYNHSLTQKTTQSYSSQIHLGKIVLIHQEVLVHLLYMYLEVLLMVHLLFLYHCFIKCWSRVQCCCFCNHSNHSPQASLQQFVRKTSRCPTNLPHLCWFHLCNCNDEQWERLEVHQTYWEKSAFHSSSKSTRCVHTSQDSWWAEPCWHWNQITIRIHHPVTFTCTTHLCPSMTSQRGVLVYVSCRCNKLV